MGSCSCPGWSSNRADNPFWVAVAGSHSRQPQPDWRQCPRARSDPALHLRVLDSCLPQPAESAQARPARWGQESSLE